MDAQNINLENISKIPESEFKKHFHQWLVDDGVARALQAKLRKDLIDTFNQTNLGRTMMSQHQKTSRIMLSPLILAVNTLVAEFLYAQNCHFSLSVFCTEVPYRNTLPDFENPTQFRFSESELYEIFEAISGDIQHDLKDAITKEYIQATEKHGSSLLYLILKTFFKKHEEPIKVIIEPNKNHFKERPKSVSDEKSKKEKRDTQQAVYNHQFRYLNKYLVILSRKVKEMANSLEHMQKRESDGPGVQRKSLKNRKLETLNRSLEKISENLRNLSISKRKNRNISVVLSAVDKLAQQFEKCASNFAIISKKVIQGKSEKVVDHDEGKSYSEWITELKTTKSGKKFIARVESSLRKTLQREKDKMQQAFEAQLESQKQLIKLKYKQRVLVQLGQHTSKEESDNGNKANGMIEKKLKELDEKHQELLKRVAESEERVRTSPKCLNLQKDLAAVSDRVEDQNINYVPLASNVIRNNRSAEENLQRFKANNYYVDRVKPQLQEMAKTIAQNERNIDHIVFDAKLRIQELEYESNELDRSFREYLQRQKSQKTNVEESVSSIWEKYNFEKIMLNKKCAALRSARNLESLRYRSDFQVENIIPNLPQIRILPDEGGIPRRDPEVLITFENPFRKLKQEILAGKDWKNFDSPDVLSKDILQSHQITDKNETLEFNEKRLNNLEYKKDFLRHISQRASTVHVITHDDENDKISKLKADRTSKEENRHRIPSDQSPISSELNLKNATLDAIEISQSKSSSSKSEAKNSKDTLKCRRSLFTGKSNKIIREDNKQNQPAITERETGAPTTSKKKSPRPNIFQQSSFLKSGNQNDTDTVKQSNEDNLEPENNTSALNLDIPAYSPSSNSTSPSFKLNLSAGRGDVSGDDFWS